MAKDILKEAIADAKAVREVALANAKAALEEAFTRKLQSMLSAKLSETLNEDDDLEENTDEAVDENVYEEETMEEDTNLDEVIDLEEILNELELEESEEVSEDTVEEAKDDDEKTVDEAKDEEEKVDEMQVIHKAETANRAGYQADYVHEDKEFDLDSLLEEINNLDENEEEVNEESDTETVDEAKEDIEESEEMKQQYEALVKENAKLVTYLKETLRKEFTEEKTKVNVEELKTELQETKKAFKAVKSELNEVNLLNSKLLYVNRIFKANQLDESQKLRVVETLDNATTIKEAKLIYETIKDTFNVAKSKKASISKKQTRTLKEGLGMASKAAGTSTAPKKEVIAESNNMVSRFQKLANIQINQ